jgi:1-deoxy-D-xylulose 5-phosphate reductoisomerase
VLDRYDPSAPRTIEDVLAIDTEARAVAAQIMKEVAA